MDVGPKCWLRARGRVAAMHDWRALQELVDHCVVR
jgi:hypothetical protein